MFEGSGGELGPEVVLHRPQNVLQQHADHLTEVSFGRVLLTDTQNIMLREDVERSMSRMCGCATGHPTWLSMVEVNSSQSQGMVALSALWCLETGSTKTLKLKRREQESPMQNIEISIKKKNVLLIFVII